MKKLSLRTAAPVTSFEIPVDFVDSYLSDASELALKVYLYLKRAALDPTLLLSVHELAERFDVTANQVVIALKHWDLKGLVSLGFSDGELSDIVLLPLPAEQAASVSTEPARTEEPDKDRIRAAEPEKTSEPLVIDFADIYRDENFKSVEQLAEFYLRKPMSSVLRGALAESYVILGRKTDLLEYLMELCIDRNTLTPNYIKSVANGWKEEGVSTVEEARSRNNTRNKNVYGVMNAFGLRSREPAPQELEYIQTWTRDFDLPIVLEACRRTMDALHAPDFKYTNGILSRWKRSGVKTMEDVAALDEKHETAKKNAQEPAQKKTSFHNFPERKTDYDRLFREHEKKKGAV